VLQSEHLSLLVGSGFTTVGVLAGVIATAMEPITLTFKNETILPRLIDAHARLSAKDVGRGSSNLEDQIRSALGLLTGLEVLGDARVSMLRDGVNELLTSFLSSILRTEVNLRSSFERGDAQGLRAQQVLKRGLTQQ
jgi:hypothetical protein